MTAGVTAESSTRRRPQLSASAWAQSETSHPERQLCDHGIRLCIESGQLSRIVERQSGESLINMSGRSAADEDAGNAGLAQRPREGEQRLRVLRSGRDVFEMI